MSSQSISTADWPKPGYAWYAVWLLIAAYTLSYLDRQILNLVLQPIKLELAISDTKASLLGGTAFVFFYVIMGVPFGWVADHGNRKRLICWGIVGWSLATAWCGIAPTYEQLFLARIGVGVGEAALTPAALSIIADTFPRHKRARPLGLYMIALTIGPGTALLVGGAILEAFKDGLALPLVGTISAWRVLFLAAALPSLPVFLLLLFTLREPVRRDTHLDTSAPNEGGRANFLRALRYIFVDHRMSFAAILLGWGGIALNMMVLLVWTPTLFVRKFGWAPADVGTTLGFIVLFAGSLGVYLGPSVVGALERRGFDDAYLRTAFGFALVLALFSVAAPLAGTATMTFVLLTPAILLNFACGALIPGTLQAFTPNRLRGQVNATFAFVNNVIGLALGPTLVALVTDYVFGDDAALPMSMAIVSGTCVPLAAAILFAGFKAFSADVAAARERARRADERLSTHSHPGALNVEPA